MHRAWLDVYVGVAREVPVDLAVLLNVSLIEERESRQPRFAGEPALKVAHLPGLEWRLSGRTQGAHPRVGQHWEACERCVAK